MRLASRHLLSITLISCALFGVSSAFNEQQAVRIDDITPQTTTSVDTVAVTNALSEYYENIVDQVMATLTEEITLSAPRSFMSIHHLGTVHRSRCRTSFRSFVHALRDHLNLMRSNLLASIRPLVESNLPAILEHKDRHTAAAGVSGLTEDILTLNQHIGNQLGLIANVDEAADIIINQSIPASLFEEQYQQLPQQPLPEQQPPRWRQGGGDQLVMGAAHPRLQQPQDDDYADPLLWLDALRLEQEQQQEEEERPESIALSNWLRSWLSEIESILSVQFDERVQDATQSILEDFLLDE